MTTPDPTTTTPPKNQPLPNPDAALLNGGPGDSQAPVTSVEQPKIINSGGQTKYEVNGKVFNSAAEMSKYVADLEKKVLTSQSTTQNPPQKPTFQTSDYGSKEMIDGRPIDEVIWENPTKVVNHIRASVLNELDLKTQQENNRKTYWEQFYKDHPDLNGKQDLVEAQVFKNWSTWEKMPVPEFTKVVADTARSSLKKMGLDKAVEVPNNNAGTLSSSNGNQNPSPTQDKVPTSFVDEVNARRLRKKIQ